MRGSCIVDSHDEVVTIVTIPVPNPVLSLSEERQLKQRIKELTRYRKNGVANAEGRDSGLQAQALSTL